MARWIWLLFALSVSCGAAAQTWPSKPVRILAPAQPGGGLDLIGRTIADQLGRSMDATFFVENVSGGGGSIAAQQVARAAPDGHILMVGYVGTHGTNPAVRKVPYDAVCDFTPIAMVGGTDQTSTGRDRYQGYVNALRKANIEVDPSLRIPGPRTKQGGFEAAVHFLSLPQKPTAAVCWNDLVAIGLMNGIARAGLVPGRDVSVTGYDDLEEAAIATPALTTVWNGQSEVGRNAARALLDKLSGSHEPDGIHLIKPEMRIRQSTGPLKPHPEG